MTYQHVEKTVQRTLLLNPGPGTTSAAVKKALITEDICPRERAFGNLLHEINRGLLEVCGGTETHEAALFVASGTGAMEAALVSAIGAENRVLIVANGAYGIRMRDICRTYNISHETCGAFGVFPDLQDLDLKLKTGAFTHLAVVHHETSTGMLNPLEKISALCAQNNVLLIADCMSTFGAYPLDLSKTSIDILFSSSNKCLHGMAGMAFVIFHKKLLPDLQKNRKSFYFDVYSQWENLKSKHQLRFTPPVQIAAAFLEAIRETLQETVAARWVRYRKNWEILYNGLAGMGFSFFLPPEQESGILLAISLKNGPVKNFEAFHDELFFAGITVYPGVIPETATFRLAVIGELYPDDINRVVKAIKEFVEKNPGI